MDHRLLCRVGGGLLAGAWLIAIAGNIVLLAIAIYLV